MLKGYLPLVRAFNQDVSHALVTELLICWRRATATSDDDMSDGDLSPRSAATAKNSAEIAEATQYLAASELTDAQLDEFLSWLTDQRSKLPTLEVMCSYWSTGVLGLKGIRRAFKHQDPKGENLEMLLAAFKTALPLWEVMQRRSACFEQIPGLKAISLLFCVQARDHFNYCDIAIEFIILCARGSEQLRAILNDNIGFEVRPGTNDRAPGDAKVEMVGVKTTKTLL